MYIPVNVNVRINSVIPIVEVKVENPKDISLCISVMIQIIEIGEKIGGRLLSDEPKEIMKPNTAFFSMIFESEQKAGEFAKALLNR